MSIGFVAAVTEIGAKIAETTKEFSSLEKLIPSEIKDHLVNTFREGIELPDSRLGGHEVENSTRALETFFKEEGIVNYYIETPFKRAEMLHQLEKDILSALDIQDKGIKMIIKEMPLNSWGRYDPFDCTLTLNQCYIENPKLLPDAIDTIIHEVRHAYQECAVETPDRYPINSETYNLWENNIRDYVQPELDREAYKKQAIEADARNFAASVVEKAFNNIYG